MLGETANDVGRGYGVCRVCVVNHRCSDGPSARAIAKPYVAVFQTFQFPLAEVGISGTDQKCLLLL